jgi:hypothetical protein
LCIFDKLENAKKVNETLLKEIHESGFILPIRIFKVKFKESRFKKNWCTWDDAILFKLSTRNLESLPKGTILVNEVELIEEVI